MNTLLSLLSGHTLPLRIEIDGCPVTAVYIDENRCVIVEGGEYFFKASQIPRDCKLINNKTEKMVLEKDLPVYPQIEGVINEILERLKELEK